MAGKKEVEKNTKRKGFNLEKDLIISILLVFLLILITVLYFLVVTGKNNSEKSLTCGDGTLLNKCSIRKPYFCSGGILVEKASLCGCLEILTKKGDSCISKYQTNPKNINLKYILRGKEKNINFVVYKGMVEHISNLSKTIYYIGNKTPSRADFKLRNINEPEQRELLLPLVTKIQNIASDKEEQMRIAVSIVQNIPFGSSNKSVKFLSNEINYSRYSYEVLYDMQGVCGEKSELLVFLLRELGYGIVFFYHQEENHESVGIKCPEEYSLRKSGYCFVETTGSSIITDDEIEYVGGVKLLSQPEIFKISEGESLEEDLYEYKDAKKWIEIRNDIKENRELDVLKYFRWKSLKEKYGLVDKYNIE